METMEDLPAGAFFPDEEVEEEVNAEKKKERKELFQINTHPAAAIAANNRRDRRLKQIVMRVVAFCKKEHEEGQLIPFRFFKKRASLMTGVSLSTIHRIETIDMKLPSPEPARSSSSSPPSSSSSSKAKVKDGQKKAAKKAKKEQTGGGGEGGGGGNVTAAHPATTTTTAVVVAGPGEVAQVGEAGSLGEQVQFHTLPQHQHRPQPAQPAKPLAKRRRKKTKPTPAEPPGPVLPNTNTNNAHINNANALITTNITTLQPTVLHTAGTGEVTTISVQTPVLGANPQQQRAPACAAWTAAPIGPFAMGDLRADTQHVHVPVSATHVQVNAQAVPVGMGVGVGQAIPVGGQLQPISVGTAGPVGGQLQPISVGTAGPQQASFTGHVGASHWATGGVATLGTLSGTATLLGPQVVHAYQGNVATAAAAAAAVTKATNPVHVQQHQQQQQQQPVFYQF